MDQLPPETPTRALLKRLHRRSSVFTASTAHNLPDNSLSLLGPPMDKLHPSSQAEEEADESQHDSSEDTPNAHKVDVGYDSTRGTLQRDNHIRQLQWQIQELKRQKMELEVELKNSKKSGKEGMTWDAARLLEREFEAQEMILKGLQRDNERRTIESELLHRRLRTMSDFLRLYHGADWQALVFGPSGDSRTTTKVWNKGGLKASPGDPKMQCSSTRKEQQGITFSGAKASPEVASVVQASVGDEIESVLGRQEEASTPETDVSCWVDAEAGSDSGYVDFSHTEGTNAIGPGLDYGDTDGSDGSLNSSGFDLLKESADESFGTLAAQSSQLGGHVYSRGKQVSGSTAISDSVPPPTLAKGVPKQASSGAAAAAIDYESLRAHLESTRLLVEGFARRCARRETELREMEERAGMALERGREAMLGDAMRIG